MSAAAMRDRARAARELVGGIWGAGLLVELLGTLWFLLAPKRLMRPMLERDE